MPSKVVSVDWKQPLNDGTLEDWFRDKYPVLTIAELIAEFNTLNIEVTHGVIDGKAKRMRLRKDSETLRRGRSQSTARFDVTGDEGVEPLTPEAAFEELARRYEFYKQYTDASTEFTFEVNDHRPIGLVGTGDWHIGNESVDVRRLYETVKAVADVDGTYFLGTGDYFDNYKAGMGRVSNGLYRESMPDPAQQHAAAKHVLNLMKGRTLAVAAGCHITWNYESAGINSIDDIAEFIGATSLRHGGVITVGIGMENYRILLRHRYAGTAANAARRVFNDYPVDEMDAAFLGHFHFNELAQLNIRGTERTFLRTGGWKEDDDYAQKIGGYQATPGMPMMILLPKEHRIIPFHADQLSDGLRYLKHLRDEYDDR